MEGNNVLVVSPDKQYKVLESLVLSEEGWRLAERDDIVDLVVGTVLTMECIMYDMDENLCDTDRNVTETVILFRSKRDEIEYPHYRWPEIALPELAKALDEDWLEEI